MTTFLLIKRSIKTIRRQNRIHQMSNVLVYVSAGGKSSPDKPINSNQTLVYNNLQSEPHLTVTINSPVEKMAT